MSYETCKGKSLGNYGIPAAIPALSLSPENIQAMVDILLDAMESEPFLVVEFIRKWVGKSLETCVSAGVKGTEGLVAKLVSYLKQRRNKKDETIPFMEF